MRVPITVVLCSVLAGASVAVAAEVVPTITVYTEPPELEIWVDGERVGIGEAVFFGPFDDYVEVTVRGEGYDENTEVIDSPTEENEDVVIVVVSEKTRGFSWASLGIGFGSGLATASIILLSLVLIDM